jgi:hypothetical protein
VGALREDGAVSMIWPASRNSEVVISDRQTGKVVWRRETAHPRGLGARLLDAATRKGWESLGQTPTHDLRDDVACYAYPLRKAQDDGTVRTLDIEVIFPVWAGSWTGPI